MSIVLFFQIDHIYKLKLIQKFLSDETCFNS